MPADDRYTIRGSGGVLKNKLGLTTKDSVDLAMEPSRKEPIMNDLTIEALAGVVYSSGKVFDGLSTGRLDTQNFLRSGSLAGIASRADLALLQDLRDVSQFIIDNRSQPIDSAYVRAVNAKITRSGPLHPGEFRTELQSIGVNTQYGRHEPKPLDDPDLQRLVDAARRLSEPREQALELFVTIAKAQPFEDGNKRTALFVANSVLIRQSVPQQLVIPFVENNATSSAAIFNDLLARAYIYDANEGVKALLREHGFGPLLRSPATGPGSPLSLPRSSPPSRGSAVGHQGRDVSDTGPLTGGGGVGRSDGRGVSR